MCAHVSVCECVCECVCVGGGGGACARACMHVGNMCMSVSM